LNVAVRTVVKGYSEMKARTGILAFRRFYPGVIFLGIFIAVYLHCHFNQTFSPWVYLWTSPRFLSFGKKDSSMKVSLLHAGCNP
jgi:hypothetical protein